MPSCRWKVGREPGSPGVSLAPLWGWGAQKAHGCPAGGETRRDLQAFPTLRSVPPSPPLHGWCLCHGATMGACPAGGPRRAARAPSPAPPGSPLAVHLLASCVSLVFLCPFYMCCCRPLPLPHSPISRLPAPILQSGAGEAAQRGQTSPPAPSSSCRQAARPLGSHSHAAASTHPQASSIHLQALALEAS